MQIKTSRKSLAGVLLPTARSPRPALLGITAYTLAVFLLGALAYRAASKHGLITRLKEYGRHGVIYLGAQLSARPEQIQIDIKHTDYLRLAYTRDKALQTRILVSSPDDFVPATIRYRDRSVPVRVRLKGDLPDHWRDEKWSLRIVVKGENTLFGMKQFSIQHPRTRGYLDEWVVHEALRREGLPALRYDFIRVVVNGKDRGIYALEEHFEKRLVEHSRRREGPIVRFNEDLCWDEIRRGLRFGQGILCALGGSGGYLAADPDAFHTNRLLSDPNLRGLHDKAIQLLELFRRGELTTSQVFDVPRLARYFAVLELLGATHAANWRNARFYYNPISSRLEPIGFDAGGHGRPAIPALAPLRSAVQNPDRDHRYYYHDYYYDSLFRDLAFYEEYVRQLERVSAPGYLEEFLEEIRDELEGKLAILHTEFPSLTYSEESLLRNRRFIRSILEPARAISAHLVERSNGTIELEVGNLQYLPVEILSLDEADTSAALADGQVLLAGRSAAKPVDYRRLAFTLPQGEPDAHGSEEPEPQPAIRYRILGAKQIRHANVLPWPRADQQALVSDLARAQPNVHEFEFVVVDEEAREVRLRPGTWKVTRDVIVPSGYRFRATAGTEIELEESALIVSRSPVEFLGRAAAPIVIRSRSGSGQGLAVIGAAQASILEHVHFQNLQAPAREGLLITGAVTFYESPVNIRACRFLDSRAEDALNIVRSSFQVSESLFQGASFDALDVDFSDGKVVNSSFVMSGNDALDVSGSAVRLQGLQMGGVGDKGLSAGEASWVSGEEIRIREAALGVAAKDLSEVRLKDVRLADSKIGFAAFQKKAEFGPASLVLEQLVLDKVEVPFLVEEGSQASVDGRPMRSDQRRVREMLYEQD